MNTDFHRYSSALVRVNPRPISEGVIRKYLTAFALLLIAFGSLAFIAEARQGGPAYYILYSGDGGLYALAPDNQEPLHLGGDFAVPQSFLYDDPNKVGPADRPPSDPLITEDLTFLEGLLAPGGQRLLFGEANCAGGRCGEGPYNLWLADLHTGERKPVLLEPAGLSGQIPRPVAWDANGDTIVFDTYDLDHQTPFAGLWRYRPDTAALEPIDLGPGDYNGRLWPSPDSRYLLTTGFAGDSAGDTAAHLQPTTRIKLLDLTSGIARTVAADPTEREYHVRGWLPAERLPELRELAALYPPPATRYPPPATPLAVPAATSGFQRPIVNHHYGWEWLDWTGSVYHPGEDYNGPGNGNADCGAPVYAVASGTVRYVNTGSWGGLVIEHVWQGTTIYSQYGHIFTSLVSVGQSVARGQHVAELGNVATVYCHLHWEIREADHPNPAYGPDWNTAILTNPALVNAYYEDPEWWVDNHGPYTACDPGTNQIALFADTSYTGQCVVKGIGDYTDAAAIGLPNDTVSSILVEGVIQADLCEHNSFGGACESFTESDPDLSNNAIGNDTVSSVRVAVSGPLVFAGLTIDDDAVGASNGNGDGQLNPGETIELHTSLQNQGDITVSGVKATLGSLDPYISAFIDNTTSNYPDIPGGGTRQSADAWEFTLDPGVPDGHVITFCLDPISAANGGPWWACFDVTVQESTAPGCDIYEPNDAAGQATPTGYGQSLTNATICPAGDVDYYAFDGQAGDRVVLDIDAQSDGSSLDATLQLLGSGASILAQSDDEVPGELRDPKLGFQLSASGRYTVRVASEAEGEPGGPAYHYTLRLILDETGPTANIISPGDNGWLDRVWTTVSVSAADADGGVKSVDFWWREAGSDWALLGTDADGRDGWSLGFDTSHLPEHQGSALRAVAADWAGNQAEDSSLNLGTDLTAPYSAASVDSLVYAPTASVPWTAGDNLSGVAAVTLWVRYEGGPWLETGLPTQPGDDGIFRYTFAFGAGAYEFATSAVDRAGNSEGAPSSADASTIYDPSNNVNLPLVFK
jgi:murein DD-endopeptidase MepM/ murein hydrolase activator NlpD